MFMEILFLKQNTVYFYTLGRWDISEEFESEVVKLIIEGSVA